MKRQPDIEIFIEDCPLEQLTAWLESTVGPLGQPVDTDEAFVYQSAVGPVIVIPAIEGGPFMSVWFNTPRSPWATDVDCGRQAARELGRTVRCCPEEHPPGVYPAPDIWLEISSGNERIIIWE